MILYKNNLSKKKNKFYRKMSIKMMQKLLGKKRMSLIYSNREQIFQMYLMKLVKQIKEIEIINKIMIIMNNKIHFLVKVNLIFKKN